MAVKPLIRRSVIEQLIAADGILTFDLAVNPLSVILLELRPLNDTVTLLNYQRYRGICAALNNVSILWNGSAVLSMRGEDIAALNWLRWGIYPWEANPDNVDNERRCVILPIIPGKFPWDPHSCLPETRKGELILQCDFDIADTGYDGLRFAVSTIELLGAKPKEYERRVMLTDTWGATGTNTLDLYAGNLCRGVLLFGTTGFGGANPSPSWGRVELLGDNQEQVWADVDWEVGMMLPTLWGRAPSMGEHKHTYDGAAAGISETASVLDVDEDFTQYMFLDLDPTKDDAYALDTRQWTRFQVRTEAETADAVRAIQCDQIKL